MNEPISPLERNVRYVVGLVQESPGKLTDFELTRETRLRHDSQNPLGLKDAKDAIAEAKQRNLIMTGPRRLARLYGDSEVYYPVTQ